MLITFTVNTSIAGSHQVLSTERNEIDFLYFAPSEAYIRVEKGTSKTSAEPR